MSVSLPAITPSQWRLQLPDYPIITNSWRSSAFPEILGSLPNNAEWSLEYENVDNAQALALLLPWRATGGGQWALDFLPPELAAGCNDANFVRRLTGTTWSVAREPQKVSVKNGRFNVTVELVHELTLTSTYGPARPITPGAPSTGIRLSILPVGLGLSFGDIVFILEPEEGSDSFDSLSPSLGIAIAQVGIGLGQEGTVLLEFDEDSDSLADSPSLGLPIPFISLM